VDNPSSQHGPEAGLHLTCYGGIERGVRNVSPVNIEKVANGLKKRRRRARVVRAGLAALPAYSVGHCVVAVEHSPRRFSLKNFVTPTPRSWPMPVDTHSPVTRWCITLNTIRDPAGQSNLSAKYPSVEGRCYGDY